MPSEVLQDKYFLCRVGAYQKVFQIAVKDYQTDGSFGFELPYSLLRLKRYKSAASFCLRAISSGLDGLNDYISLLSYCLAKYSPSYAEIRSSIQLLKSGNTKRSHLLILVENLECTEARHKCIELLISQCNLTDDDVRLLDARISKKNGDLLNALSTAQDLVAKNPLNHDAALLAADILFQSGYVLEAQRFVCLVLKHDQANLAALESLALCLYKRCKWQAARKIFKQINNITHDDISLISSMIILPPFQINGTELSAAILGFKELDYFLDTQPQLLGIVESLALCKVLLPSEFYLPYEGPVKLRRNLELIRRYHALSAQKIINDIKLFYGSVGAPRKYPSQSRSAKIKIGFISRFFSCHTNQVAHYGLISKLDKDMFEIYVLHKSGSVRDSCHYMLNQETNHVIDLPEELGECCGIIAKLQLDVLFFTDIGMNPFDSLMALPHFARFQVTSWGLPHTTGVPEIDYHLRSSIFFDCEDQGEYTEQLVELPGYLGYFEHPMEVSKNVCRDYFLLPPDRFLVGCLQSLHKIHPDFDEYLERIAAIDESIMIIISPSENDHVMHAFVRRLHQSAPNACRRQQFCIVSRSVMDDFLGLNSILDLNLDTIYYGAGVSFIQTLWCGPPYITQWSNQVRASTVSRSYRYAGIEKPPIAHSMDEYVDLVRYYFENREELADLRREIQEKAEGTIYQNMDYIRGYEDFFQGLCAAGPGGATTAHERSLCSRNH